MFNFPGWLCPLLAATDGQWFVVFGFNRKKSRLFFFSRDGRHTRLWMERQDLFPEMCRDTGSSSARMVRSICSECPSSYGDVISDLLKLTHNKLSSDIWPAIITYISLNCLFTVFCIIWAFVFLMTRTNTAVFICCQWECSAVIVHGIPRNVLWYTNNHDWWMNDFFPNLLLWWKWNPNNSFSTCKERQHELRLKTSCDIKYCHMFSI